MLIPRGISNCHVVIVGCGDEAREGGGEGNGRKLHVMLKFTLIHEQTVLTFRGWKGGRIVSPPECNENGRKVATTEGGLRQQAGL